MTATINATTTNGVVVSADTSGALALQTNNGTTAVTFDTSQNATFVGSVNAPNTFGYKNVLINGAMQVAQRGTSTSLTTSSSNYGALDRFVAYQGTSANGNFTQLTNGTGLYKQFQYIAKVQRTVGSTGTGAIYMGQAVETVNSFMLAGNTVTLSFYAYKGANFSASSSLINVNMYTGTGTDQSFSNMTGGLWTGQTTPISTTQAITTTLTRYSFTGTVPSTATQVGLQIGWTPTGTAGADDSLYITGIQLELGSVATSYDFRDFGSELARCMRYFEKSFDYGTAPAHAVGGLPVTPIGSSLGCGGNAYWIIPFKVTKRNASYSIRWYDPLASHTSTENWVRAITACDSGTAYGPNSNMQLNSNTTAHFGGYSQVGTGVPPIFYWTVENEL